MISQPLPGSIFFPSAPDTLLQPYWGAPPIGAHLFHNEGHESGWEWHDEVGHWCLLTNIVSGDHRATQAEQTQLVLARLEALLEEVGLAFRDVIRTWFFLDDILSWYDTFNEVRTEFFRQRQLLHHMPASTAVGPCLDGRVTLLSGLLALKPVSNSANVYPVVSPSQGSAFDYGSSFSRAMEVSCSRGKRLYVSGTASIDGEGRTLHAGALIAQANETFRIVHKLLDSRGFSFDDVTQAVCYVAHVQDVSLARLLAAKYLGHQTSMVRATICRPDLEFEVELVASH